MPHLELASSALAPGISPVRVSYRDAGSGPPIVMLHGGWGYEIYPFDRQIAGLAGHRVIIPDRTGYGRSGRIERLETDFHHRAAAETWAVIEALDLDRPVLWGHSDGAVIALLMGLAGPDRLGGIVVEAAHLFRRKPASREFFQTMMDNPGGLGERVVSILAHDHGHGWPEVIRANGDAWLRIGADPSAHPDLYDGRLGELRVPTLAIHGARDPRTEPGELAALRDAIARDDDVLRQFVVLPEGGHSPHSERATSDEVTRVASAFLRGVAQALRPPAMDHAAAPRPRSPEPAGEGGGPATR